MSGINQKNKRGSVVVAMSGGVDSSLAACLLAEQGYEIIGFTLLLHDGGERERRAAVSARRCCGSAESAARARQAALKAGGRHHLIDARREFKEAVIENFELEYAAGRTPNPCIRCNTYLKWGFLFNLARDLGAEYFATGHHARIACDESGGYKLKSAVDPGKDQGYALWGIQRNLLQHTILPVGEMPKSRVRELATRYGLVAADMPDSQEICFIPDDDYRSYLEERLGIERRDELAHALEPGEVVDSEGRVLGWHDGVARYTIGQRHGLGVAAGRPLYVEELDPETRRIVLGDGSGLLAAGLNADQANWVSIDPPLEPFRAQVRIRYRSQPAAAIVIPEDRDSFTVRFDEGQRAVTPGQSAVVYDGEIILGGGVINRQVQFS